MTRLVANSLRVVAAMAVTVACRAPSPVPPVPGQGGPAWCELTSRHFTIWTDAASDRVRALVHKMERLHQILVAAAFPTAPADGRVLAIVLRDDAELRAFSATGQARPFAREPQFPLWQPMIVLSATTPPGDLEVTLAHELIHAISFGVIHHQPRWFGEGMATYFESVALDPKLETATIGGAPTGKAVRIAHLLPISELFAWTGAAKEETRQYVTAWALFWFLSNEHAADLRRYMRLLDAADAEIEHRPELARRVWDQAFPALPLGAVDRQLRDWLFHGTHRETELRFGARDGSVIERALGDADAYAARAMLRSIAGRRGAEARAEVAAALAAESTHVLAWLLAAALDRRAITVDDARPIASAHPDDWRAWLLLATAVQDAPGDVEVFAARTRACELAAANPALLPPPKLCPRETALSAP